MRNPGIKLQGDVFRETHTVLYYSGVPITLGFARIFFGIFQFYDNMTAWLLAASATAETVGSNPRLDKVRLFFRNSSEAITDSGFI